MTRPQTRKTLATHGPRGASVRVLQSTDLTAVIVLWREHGAPKQKSWPNTAAGRSEAKAWAKAFSDARLHRKADVPRITVRELWTRFATAEFPALRPRSQKLYAEYWKRWELFIGRHAVAEDTTLENVDDFRAALERQGLAVNTIGHVIRNARMVYSWGERRELLGRNRFALYRYKVAKEDRPASVPEYRSEDFQKLLAQLDPTKATQWRPYVALALCGYQGTRQNAVLQLEWADITEDWVTWRAETDKQGRVRVQPLRTGAIAALAVASMWRARNAYTGPYVLPAGSSKNKDGTHYTAQSLWLALTKAEKRAGIPHEKGRGAHGLRRMLFGDVVEETGDVGLAMQAIGDTDLRVAGRYFLPRTDRLEAAFAKMDDARTAPESHEADRDGTVNESDPPSAESPLTPSIHD